MTPTEPPRSRIWAGTAPASSKPQLKAALVRYRVMAYVVGVLLLILVFVGIPLQYGAGSQGVVSVVGPIHGICYIVYLVAGADLARRARWRVPQMAAVVAAGFLPFLAFVVERHVTHQVDRELQSSEG